MYLQNTYVVGELVSINPMRIKKENGIESKKIEFKLQDIEYVLST